MQTERRVAANPQTKPVDFGCESATIHIRHRHCYYHSARKLILIYHPTKDGRLSIPGHCSKGTQPRLFIEAAVAINISVHGVIRTWVLSHTAVKNKTTTHDSPGTLVF